MRNASKRKKRAGTAKAKASASVPAKTPLEPAVPPAPDPLVERYGEPFYTSKKGDFAGINQSYWAGLFAMENRIVFVPEENAFYACDLTTGLWSVVSFDSVKQRTSSRLLDASREIDQPGLDVLRTDKVLGNILAQLRGIVEKRDAFKGPRKYIHLANGVIRWTAGEADLVGFSPDFYSRNRSPIAFDETAQCPRFLGDLLGPAVEPDDILVLQKYAGQSLLGHNIIQRAMILTGASASGKSTVCNVIRLLVGQDNVTQLRTRFLEDRFELFEFVNKTLLVGVDVPPDFLTCPSSSAIKGLIGGDWFTAEQKFGSNRLKLQGNFCLIATANTALKVRIQGDADAWHRRLLLVPFKPVIPAKRVPDFATKLVKEEGAGILNWALRGLDLLLQDVKATGDIVLTGSQTDRITSLLFESNSLQNFIEARLERAPESDLSCAEIGDEYARFCQQKSWSPLPLPVVQKQLESLLHERFSISKSHCVQRNGHQARGFKGVKFK